ncbi:YbaN family protein [Falsigemmobacter faecalis]|uniref:DUF454 domain-containing protein n=1 Tax=Falsigemmobacter faecalis TaxID=2488730 RepID=A0A3P3DVX5_9RHOB|nr:YbaN family protein [Falsigemmobacter faecalis]RRH78154.1 DUF454 domain-containing protein [Falsigemmobacter faecalis]
MTEPRRTPPPLRFAWFVLGCLMLVLGIIGAVLPVMPTTVFLILAAWFFGRSSPRLEAWLLRHPTFGPPLQAWRLRGAVPRKAKGAAVLGMTLGYAGFLGMAGPSAGLAVAVAAPILLSALFLLTRPD